MNVGKPAQSVRAAFPAKTPASAIIGCSTFASTIADASPGVPARAQGSSVRQQARRTASSALPSLEIELVSRCDCPPRILFNHLGCRNDRHGDFTPRPWASKRAVSRPGSAADSLTPKSTIIDDGLTVPHWQAAACIGWPESARRAGPGPGFFSDHLGRPGPKV